MAARRQEIGRWTAAALMLVAASGASAASSGTAAAGDAATQTGGASWTQWGGPARDFSVTRAVSAGWDGSGPRQLWRRPLGPGYAAVIVEADRLFTSYRENGQEVVVGLSRQDGRTLWEHRHDAAVTSGHSLDTSYGEGPNSTPLLVSGRIYAVGFTGIVSCLDATSGARLWSHDLKRDYNQVLPYFGHSSSPVHHEDSLIVVAGDIYSFDLATGELLWRRTDVSGSYASAALIPRQGRTLLLLPGAGEVAGLDASTGDILWRHELANEHKTILSSPVFGSDNWALVSAYFVGSMGLELAADGSSAEPRWRMPHLQLSHSNAVRMGDHVYGFHNSILTAVNIKTGEIAWRQRGFRRANLLRAGNDLLLLDEMGKLSLATPHAGGVKIRAEAQIFKERTWTVPTVVDRTLLVRTQKELVAFDLESNAAAAAPLAAGQAQVDPTGPPPREFTQAFARLLEAVHAAHEPSLEQARTELTVWLDGAWSHLAHYALAVVSWQEMETGHPGRRLALLNEAVAHLDAAVSLHPGYGDAHALLGRLYPLYYQLDPRRAAVIGPMTSEHLALAELLDPGSPRVQAALGMGLFYRDAEYGGDQTQGLEKLRESLRLYGLEAKHPARSPLAWGEALTWAWYGSALLDLPQPDRQEARMAFKKALALEPRFAQARTRLAALGD